MTVDWHELNAVVTLITAAVPDVGSLPENINTPPGAREVALDLANAFFFPSSLLTKTTRSRHLRCPTSGVYQLCSSLPEFNLQES